MSARAAVRKVSCCLLALAAGVVVTSCGEDPGKAAAASAFTYLSDLNAGDMTDACVLQTPATVGLERDVGQLVRRYTVGSNTPCSLGAILRPGFLGEGDPPRPTRTVIQTLAHSKRAFVYFPKGTTGLIPNPLPLFYLQGKWEADATDVFISMDSSAAVANLEEASFFSPACLSEWNASVAEGLVSVPKLPGSSRSVWAFLIGTPMNGASACAGMTLDDPSGGYCETFIQAGGGSWMQQQCARVAGAWKLQRNVWLDARGIAIPASTASPDGSVPALTNAAATLSSASQPGVTDPQRTEPAATSTTAQPSPTPSTGASTSGLPPGDSESGVAPVADSGPVPDRKQCNANVSTDLNRGDCAVAEQVFTAASDAYGIDGNHIPANVIVKDSATGRSLAFSCQVLSMAQEVACGSSNENATFSVSSVQGS